MFEGQIIVQVERGAEVFYDFEDDNSYETAVISEGKLSKPILMIDQNRLGS